VNGLGIFVKFETSDNPVHHRLTRRDAPVSAVNCWTRCDASGSKPVLCETSSGPEASCCWQNCYDTFEWDRGNYFLLRLFRERSHSNFSFGKYKFNLAIPCVECVEKAPVR
jgi:hypothetical protein